MSTNIIHEYKTHGDIKREKLAAWHKANGMYARAEAHVLAVEDCVANIMGKPTRADQGLDQLIAELHNL